MAKARRVLVLVIAVALAASLVACGGGDGGDDEDGSTGTTTAEGAAADGTLDVLVTSADGLASPGMSALVQRLFQEPATSVVVAAPDVANPFPPAPVADGEVPATTYGATLDGYPGVAVAAGAEDTVRAAIAGGLDGLPEDVGTPDLVIAGIGDGQLIGSLAEFSANVPAARAAAGAGVPALVVAQGLDATPPDYGNGVTQTLAWIEEHRAALTSRDAPVAVTVLSVPTCAAGEPRGVVEVPIAADDAGRPLNVVDCGSAAEDPADDVAAFTTGFATLTDLPVEPAAPSATTAPAAPTTAAPA